MLPALLLSLAALPQAASAPPGVPPLVLVVLIDDVGWADTKGGRMPHLDELRSAGLDFTRAYAHSWCAPTRDSLLFGRLQGRFRGDLCLGYQPGISHEGSEPSVMEALEEAGWTTWMIGKWHQGNAPRSGVGWEEGPLFWWDHWLAGTDYSSNPTSRNACNDPGRWQNPVLASPTLVVDDGFLSTDTRYDLVREREAALHAIATALQTPEPDFVYVSTQAAHEPWAFPPNWMMPDDWDPPLLPDERDLFEAEVLALDETIDDLVRAAGPSAWIVVAGDNGTPCAVDEDNLRGCKQTEYEGGLRVPLVLVGPGLTPGKVQVPVHVMDVTKTLLRSLGLASPWHQGADLTVPRNEGVACWGGPNGGRAIVEERYKLIRPRSGVEEMYDLLLDPGETKPLALSGPDYDRLLAKMEAAFR